MDPIQASDNPYASPPRDPAAAPAESDGKVVFSDESRRRLQITSGLVLFLSVISGLIVLNSALQFVVTMRYWIVVEGSSVVQLQFYSNMAAAPVWGVLTYLLWKYSRLAKQVAKRDGQSVTEMIAYQTRCWITIALLAAQMILSSLAIGGFRVYEQMREFNRYSTFGPVTATPLPKDPPR